MFHNQREHAVFFARFEQDMPGLAAERLKIAGRAAVGRQHGQDFARLHLRQGFFGFQNRQRASEPLQV